MLLNNMSGGETINRADTFNINPTGKGTKEWADENYNIGKGCSHDCLYCYAFGGALDRNQIESREEWKEEFIREDQINRKLGKKYTDKVVMFPSTHDITPKYLDSAIIVIQKLLNNNNNLLLVSKPHLDCIMKICDSFKNYKDKILFRFTIGSLNEQVCKFWEPHAPPPDERLEALKYAFEAGFQTSISCEPMLKGIEDIYKVVDAVLPCVTGTIWIGKMNMRRNRTDRSLPELDEIRKLQGDNKILEMVANLKNNPKIQWKDSIKEVIWAQQYGHLKINKTFTDYFPKLGETELEQLEKNIRNGKCRDKIITWNDTIIDGLDHYRIYKKLYLDFEIERKDFKTKKDVITWIASNQNLKIPLEDSVTADSFAQKYGHLKINQEFQKLIPALSEEEYKQLQENIEKEGCRDKIITWNNTIIDGHNRYKICSSHNLELSVEEKHFSSQDEAITWIIDNQLGRRNLTDKDRAYLIGEKYNRGKKQGQRTDLTSGQNEQKFTIAEKLAQKENISAKSVQRSGLFAANIDTLTKNTSAEFTTKLRNGKIKATYKEITELANLPPDEQNKMAIEAITTNKLPFIKPITTEGKFLDKQTKPFNRPDDLDNTAYELLIAIHNKIGELNADDRAVKRVIADEIMPALQKFGITEPFE